MNFLVHVKGQQEDKGCYPESSTCSTSPLWVVPSLWFVYIRYSVFVPWNGFVPTCLLLSSSHWLCRSPGSEGFPPANPKALLYLTVTPFLLQEMSHSVSELDMAAQCWLGGCCSELFSLILLSGRAVPVLGLSNHLSHLRQGCLPPLPGLQRGWISGDIVFLVGPKPSGRKEKPFTGAKARLHHAWTKGT